MPTESSKLNVEGMSCNHCVMSIKKAVEALEGVAGVDVNLKAKQVTVDYDSTRVNVETIKNSLEDQGYDVKEKRL